MTRRLIAATGCSLCFAAMASAQEPSTTAKELSTATATLATTATTVPTTVAPTATSSTTVARDANSAAIVRDPRNVEFRIGPEDVLDIMVWKNPELSRTVPVRPDGMVSLPLVNDIKASGLTPSELRIQVAQRLEDYVPSPEVAVIVREVHSVKIAVIGAVKLPGRYEIKTPATVLEMIAMAQGLTEFADKRGIAVLRQVDGSTQRIPFNYRKVADGSEQENFFVRPGDIIVVP